MKICGIPVLYLLYQSSHLWIHSVFIVLSVYLFRNGSVKARWNVIFWRRSVCPVPRRWRDMATEHFSQNHFKRNIYFRVLYLPGHWCSLQALEMIVSPVQSAPLNFASRAIQRSPLCDPPPHVWLHGPQMMGDHSQLTEWRKSKVSFLLKQVIFCLTCFI